MSDDVKGVTVVDVEISNNAWWDDILQFGVQGDLSWSFTNKTFQLYLKVSRADTSAVVTMASGSTITVVDPTQRILQMNLPDTTIRANLLPDDLLALPTGWVVPAGATAPGANDSNGRATKIGHYEYDLIMVDSITNARDMLMQGDIVVKRGVTV